MTSTTFNDVPASVGFKSTPPAEQKCYANGRAGLHVKTTKDGAYVSHDAGYVTIVYDPREVEYF